MTDFSLTMICRTKRSDSSVSTSHLSIGPSSRGAFRTKGVTSTSHIAPFRTFSRKKDSIVGDVQGSISNRRSGPDAKRLLQRSGRDWARSRAEPRRSATFTSIIEGSLPGTLTRDAPTLSCLDRDMLARRTIEIRQTRREICPDFLI